MSKHIRSLIVFSVLGAYPIIFGAMPVQAQTQAQTQLGAPQRTYDLSLSQLSSAKESKIYGLGGLQSLQFTLPRNQLVTKAHLELVFTPSPALLPQVSHLRVYLNDELMQVVPIQPQSPGKPQSQSVALDPAFLSTYNRIKFEFVGLVSGICQDLTSPALWLDISRKTHVSIQEQALRVGNELSYFPEPFLDTNDMLTQTIPFVFSAKPNAQRIEVATTLASYFGTLAKWRNVHFPVTFGELPKHAHTIVMATNDQRPAFLKDYPPVNQATIDMISAPDDPYQKLLLILGRNEDDLKIAVTALTLGSALFRGQSVQVTAVDQLAPRKPYDAPNWVPLNRPVFFSELVEFPGQLDVSGLRPSPIRLNINVPPDLFVWRSRGIPLDLRFNYTQPLRADESRLTVSLNDRLVSSASLRPTDAKGGLLNMNLPVVGNDEAASTTEMSLPTFRIGGQNQLSMDFSFTSTAAGERSSTCIATSAPDIRAAVDPNSSIDFSGYTHYTELPNLRIFANSGFPFSRMADLSETVVVLNKEIEPVHVSTLLKVVGQIGAQTGYPAYKLRIVQDWTAAQEIDADLLWIGESPQQFRDRPDANLLLNYTTATLARPLRAADDQAGMADVRYIPKVDVGSALTIAVQSVAPIAAIVGMQSPYFQGRSMVGLLATTSSDFRMLNEALSDVGKRNVMQGSVVIIRSSGVESHLVGPRYFVGNLAWWQRLWFHFSERPFFFLTLTVIVSLLTAWVFLVGLRSLTRRRLKKDA